MKFSDYTKEEQAKFRVENYLQNVGIEQAAENITTGIENLVKALGCLDPLATVDVIKQLQYFIPGLEVLADKREKRKAELEKRILDAGEV